MRSTLLLINAMSRSSRMRSMLRPRE